MSAKTRRARNAGLRAAPRVPTTSDGNWSTQCSTCRDRGSARNEADAQAIEDRTRTTERSSAQRVTPQSATARPTAAPATPSDSAGRSWARIRDHRGSGPFSCLTSVTNRLRDRPHMPYSRSLKARTNPQSPNVRSQDHRRIRERPSRYAGRYEHEDRSDRRSALPKSQNAGAYCVAVPAKPLFAVWTPEDFAQTVRDANAAART